MNKTCFIIMLTLIFFIPFAAAYQVELVLKDEAKHLLKNITVQVVFDNQTQYIVLEDKLVLELPEGQNSFVLKADEARTLGKDFFKKVELAVYGNVTGEVILLPVGSLRGFVKDRLDNVIPNAELKFECANNIGIDFPIITDKFGSFSVDYLSTGSCRIFAKHGKVLGFKDVKIEQGDLADININLDTSIIAEHEYGSYIVLLVVVVFIAAVAFGLLRKRNFAKKKKAFAKKRSKEVKETKAKILLGKRAKDILETLKERENEIIKFVAESGGKTTQSKIYNELGIPKASLSRYIQSLEMKKIIEVSKIGKVKKIKLTDWFLAKE